MGASILPPQDRLHSKLITLATKVSARDLATIQAKLNASSLSISTYLREAALSAQVNPPTIIPQVNSDQWEELGRMGSNLNQIAAGLNARGVIDPYLQELLDHNRTLLAQVREALLGKESHHGVPN